MTEWKTSIGRGFGFGIGLMTFIALVDAALIGLTATRPLTFGTFLIGLAALFGLGLFVLIGYWVYGLAGSRYILDRNALIIRWGPTEQVIPAADIEQVFTGAEVEGDTSFYGGVWPGHWVGYGQVSGLGQTLFYATEPPREQVFIATPGLVYGISPSDRERFLKSLRKRLQMGPTQVVEQSSKRPTILHWTIWGDWLGLTLLGVGSLALLGLIGLLCLQFPSLPLLIPLHFNAAGNPDRLGPRAEVFVIPLIGLLALLLNGALGGLLYRHERVASYLLWGGAILVQVLVWTAAIGVLAQA